MKKLSSKYTVIFFCLSTLMAAAYGIIMNGSSVFLIPISEMLNLSQGKIAITSTLTTLATAITSLLIPFFMSKNNFKKLILFGLLICFFSSILMSQASKLWHFYLLYSIRGFGMSFFGTVPVMQLITNWFDKLHGIVTSGVVIASGLTGSLVTPIFARIITESSLQLAFVVSAFSILFLGLPTLIFSFKFTPFEEDMVPYGYKAKPTSNVVPKTSDNPISIRLSLILFSLFSILSTSLLSFQSFLPGHAMTIGLNFNVGAMLISATLIGNIVQKVVFGYLNDKFSPFLATKIILFLTLASFFLLLTTYTPLVIVGSFLFGGVYSLNAIALSTITRELYKPLLFGKVYPKVSFLGTFFGSFSAPAVGFIYEYFGNYNFAILMFIIIQLINMGIIFTLESMNKDTIR